MLQKNSRLTVIFLLFIVLNSFHVLAQKEDPNCAPAGFRWNDPDPGWEQELQMHHYLFTNYINGLPPSILKTRLQTRADLIQSMYLDENSNQFDFTTCIAYLGKECPYQNGTVYYEENPVPLHSHFMIITHPTFDYSRLISVFKEVNDLTNNYNDSQSLLIINGDAKMSSDKDLSDRSTLLTLHWPKFQGDWISRKPKYIYKNSGGFHEIDYRATEVTIIGGAFGHCHKSTMYCLVDRDHPSNPNCYNDQDLIFHLPMYGIGMNAWESLEDEYIISDNTWDFVDWFNAMMVPPVGYEPIFTGDDDRFHIITKINGVEVERKGGDPSSAIRTLTLDLTSKDNVPTPKLPDLAIKDFFIKNEHVYFSITNSGNNPVRTPVEVEYKLQSIDGRVFKSGVFQSFDGLVGSISKEEYWIVDIKSIFPQYLTLVIDPDGNYYESQISNNQQTISTGW